LKTPRVVCCLVGGLLTLIAAGPLVGRAFANVSVGEPIENFELKTLDGQVHAVLGKNAVANVVVFFRPEQEHSADALKEMADCEKVFASKPVHWVAVVSDSWEPGVVRTFVAESGIKMPVLIDQGDVFYGKLGVKLHPTIGVFDAKRRLTAYEPFRQINYCDRIKGRIQLVLGEITEAQFAAIENPARSETRSETGVSRRHLNFARQLLRVEQYDKALAEVDKSLEVGPSADAYALRGQILAAKKKCPEALRAFDAALKLDPANADAIGGTKTCGR